jgi:methionyl-tRNA formyltransferase
MDEKSFDNGTILAQKKFGIPDPQKISFDRLMHFLKRNAASILVQGLRKHVFVPPLIDVGSYKPANLIHAHKITPATREVDWAATTPVEIDRKYRALGPQLWTNILVNSSGDKDATRRVIFRDIQVVPMPASLRMFFRGAQFTGREGRLVRRESDADVHFFVYERNGVRQNMPQMYVVADDGQAIIIAQSANQSACVRVREITVAGKPQVPAAQAMRTFKDHEAWDLSRRASGGIRSDPKTGEGLVRRQAGGGLVRREARNYPLVRRTLAPPHPRKETAPIGRYEKARLAKVPPVAASGGGGGDVESKP